MIVGVVTDLQMAFTCDRFKLARLNNELVFKVSIPQKKIVYGHLEKFR